MNSQGEYTSLVWESLYKEATASAAKEPLLKPLMDEVILNHPNLKSSLSYRLATKLGGTIITYQHWLKIFQEAYDENRSGVVENLEYAAAIDLAATHERDPACDSLLTAFMYFKGYKALQVHRVAHCLWRADRKELASLMQSRSSEVFGVDIHPAAHIGRGFMVDHATGLVIGETARIGDNCTFLHSVTLGSTGKHHGDRHPKVGNNVSIGCSASVLGNITIGDGAKIGSGSVVLKDVPAGATAVGLPSRLLTSSKSKPLPIKENCPITANRTLCQSTQCENENENLKTYRKNSSLSFTNHIYSSAICAPAPSQISYYFPRIFALSEISGIKVINFLQKSLRKML